MVLMTVTKPVSVCGEYDIPRKKKRTTSSQVTDFLYIWEQSLNPFHISLTEGFRSP